MTINPAMYSSETDQHNTPKQLVKKIATFLDGIELDPCTDASNPVGAASFYTEADNGLQKAWVARTVYMNPPYGREIIEWVWELDNQFTLGLVDEAIALVPARTDTNWWHIVAKYPVCFVKGRLKFNDCKQSAPFPSALIYLGENWQGFAQAFGDLGLIYLPVACVERIQESYKVNA